VTEFSANLVNLTRAIATQPVHELHAILALTIGVLSATGAWLLMQRSMFQSVIGVGLLGHACNLFIFAVGGLTRWITPIMGPEATTLTPPYADPLPQALILTAIVIGMGLQLFLTGLLAALAYVRRHEVPATSARTEADQMAASGDADVGDDLDEARA